MSKHPWPFLTRVLRRVAGASHRPSSVVAEAFGQHAGDYPGDFEDVLEIHYDPHPDGRPDPGEIVWAWVPYEEDHSKGKDRPVLLIGQDDSTPGGPWLLGLQLTSKDHDRDHDQERRAGRLWVDIGSGDWDRQGRPSEVRVNRILRVHAASIRREGAVLAETVFEHVAAAVHAAQSR